MPYSPWGPAGSPASTAPSSPTSTSPRRPKLEPRQRFVLANSLRLHYLEWGDPSLPPAVLLHATGFLARLWQPVAEALSVRFHVLAYDSRGHGDSDKPALSAVEGPADGYHWQNFVDDLRGFLDALGLPDILAVGHSVGGAAIAYLAATEPQRLSRAVLIEPIIVPPHEGPPIGSERRHDLAAGARRRRLVWSSTDELYRSYCRRPTFTRWRDDVLRLYAEQGTFRRQDGQVELKCPGEIEAQVFENSSSLDIWSVLPQVACPTLVMRGEHTDAYLALIAESVAARVPNGRLATIAGAGHLTPMERPQAVVAEILAFAQRAP